MEHLLKKWNCIFKKREAEVVMQNKEISFQLHLCIAEKLIWKFMFYSFAFKICHFYYKIHIHVF